MGKEILAMMPIPKEVPNWDIVLNTAPAGAWVFSGKTSVMTRFETVKRTAPLVH